jgi:hypothetical protein
MAELLPPDAVGLVTPAVARMLRRLKQLPDGYIVRQWLDPTCSGPTAWLCDEDGRSALLVVSAATPRTAQQAIQQGLFAQDELIGTEELTACASFIHDYCHNGVPLLLLVPQVAEAELLPALVSLPPGVAVAAREHCTPEAFPSWLAARLSSPLNATTYKELRRAFCPELVVPPTLTVRPHNRRATEAALGGYLLSYDQEWLLKHDLTLSDEGMALQDELGVTLVNGVAGSGKSLLLLYRARLLRQYFPRKRILVLTHNRPLIRDLRRRYLALSNGDQQIEWRTFHGWCHTYWPAAEPRLQLIGSRERQALVRAIKQSHLADLALAPESLLAEIDWLKDRLITTREGYREADRSGRGFGLNSMLRDRVYDAMLAYQQHLHERDRADFGDVPRRIWRAIQEQRAQFPTYDFVLIDEAQFFAPIWFAIIKELLAPQHGRLFMVADPTQGFMQRRQSWLASGLHVRGRSHRLETCYRTSGPILAFAQHWYQQRLPDDDEAFVGSNVVTMPDGPPPEVIAVGSEHDELTRVINEIRGLVEHGTPLQHILVLHADWQGAARALERLQAVFGTAAVINPRQAAGGHHVRVCAIDAATGLESPIVFVLGSHRLCEAEQSIRLSPEEQAERRRDNTRRLYMAFTRAGQRLAVTYVGTPPLAMQPTVQYNKALS